MKEQLNSALEIRTYFVHIRIHYFLNCLNFAAKKPPQSLRGFLTFIRIILFFRYSSNSLLQNVINTISSACVFHQNIMASLAYKNTYQWLRKLVSMIYINKSFQILQCFLLVFRPWRIMTIKEFSTSSCLHFQFWSS